MVKTQSNKDILELRSFPLKLVSLVFLFIIVGLYGILFEENDFELIDGFMFFGICFIALCIPKHKEVRINKPENSVKVKERSIFFKKEVEFKIDEINNIEMSKGRGQYASGGSILVSTKDANIIIADSDLGKNKDVKLALNKVLEFLNFQVH